MRPLSLTGGGRSRHRRGGRQWNGTRQAGRYRVSRPESRTTVHCSSAPADESSESSQGSCGGPDVTLPRRPFEAAATEHKMLLAIDVGNTNIVLGVFDG